MLDIVDPCPGWMWQPLAPHAFPSPARFSTHAGGAVAGPTWTFKWKTPASRSSARQMLNALRLAERHTCKAQ